MKVESPIKVGLKTIACWNNDSMEAQVQRYEQEPVEKGQIVFYGPSNFTRWRREKWGATPLREALPGKSGKPCAINRGFGSSCTEHHLYYYSRMVRPLEPKVLVYAPGLGNAMHFGYTPEETFALAQRVVLYALSDFPDLRVYILGLDFGRSRLFGKEIPQKEVQFQSWLKEFAEITPNCSFLDVSDYAPLHNKELFAEDHAHFNPAGYEVYAEFFKEALKQEFDLY